MVPWGSLGLFTGSFGFLNLVWHRGTDDIQSYCTLKMGAD